MFSIVFIVFEHGESRTTDCTCLLEFLNSNKKVLNKSPILQTKLVKAPSKHKDEAGCCSDASNVLWKEIHNHLYLPKLHAFLCAEKLAKHAKKQGN